MDKFSKSAKLDHVCYDIRGPVHKKALQLEEEGHKILKLNIGNPAPFGFEAPDEILVDVIRNLPTSQGYCDSKGLYSARKAIVHYYQTKGLRDITVNDVYIGNGVSELITMSMQEAKITPKTKAIVVINPNNPTGAVYSKEILLEIAELARKHGLIIYADEIYDKILYDGAVHHHIAALAPDLLTITFNGLSKAYRVAGFRQGWMVLNGPKHHAQGYIEGLDMLASMRLCATTPMQHAIQTALGGYQSINELIAPGGRLLEQRNKAYELITQIPGISCVKPMGAMYMFPKIDTEMYNIHDDMKFVYDLLVQEKVLLVHGTGFNWVKPDHFRIVTLAYSHQIEEAIGKLERFLKHYRQ